MVGPDWSLTEEYQNVFCNIRDEYHLAIPLETKFEESVKTCKHKLKSTIPCEQDHEFFSNTWHGMMTSLEVPCPFIWTPLSDQESEDDVLDVNNNTQLQNKQIIAIDVFLNLFTKLEQLA